MGKREIISLCHQVLGVQRVSVDEYVWQPEYQESVRGIYGEPFKDVVTVVVKADSMDVVYSVRRTLQKHAPAGITFKVLLDCP